MYLDIHQQKCNLQYPLLWRVVLNEYIELAKDFGGTDGHKYVNGVLNALAQDLRAPEVQADRKRRP